MNEGKLTSMKMLDVHSVPLYLPSTECQHAFYVHFTTIKAAKAMVCSLFLVPHF